MKKLIFLLAFAIYISACNDDSSKTTSASSTESIFTGKFAILKDHPNKRHDSIVNRLVDNVDKPDSRNKDGKIRDKGKNSTELLIIELVGRRNVSLLDIRYSEYDETQYCDSRNLKRNSNAILDPCKVAYYTNQILKVQINKNGVAPEFLYYDCYTICPPPEPCPEDQAMKGSTQ